MIDGRSMPRSNVTETRPQIGRILMHCGLDPPGFPAKSGAGLTGTPPAESKNRMAGTWQDWQDQIHDSMMLEYVRYER